MNRFMLIVLVFLSTALYIACSPKEKIFIIAPGDPIAANAGFTLTDYLSKTYHGMSFEFSETEIEGYRNIVLKISASGELENDESFRISGTADQLFITGKSSRALVNGVYDLLKQIGWSFYLSYDVPPAEPELLNFTEIQIENTPLIEKRIVFNWHNFLSGCSSWDFEHWQDWIDNSEKIGFNTIMVHAYGNNPMHSFTFNGPARNRPVPAAGSRIFPPLKPIFSTMSQTARMMPGSV